MPGWQPRLQRLLQSGPRTSGSGPPHLYQGYGGMFQRAATRDVAILPRGPKARAQRGRQQGSPKRQGWRHSPVPSLHSHSSALICYHVRVCWALPAASTLTPAARPPANELTTPPTPRAVTHGGAHMSRAAAGGAAGRRRPACALPARVHAWRAVSGPSGFCTRWPPALQTDRLQASLEAQKQQPGAHLLVHRVTPEVQAAATAVLGDGVEAATAVWALRQVRGPRLWGLRCGAAWAQAAWETCGLRGRPPRKAPLLVPAVMRGLPAVRPTPPPLLRPLQPVLRQTVQKVFGVHTASGNNNWMKQKLCQGE